MHKFLLGSLAFILAISLSASPIHAALRVGLVLDKGGKDDKSFNASAFKGATEAQKKFKVDLKTVEASEDSMIEPSLRSFAQRGYDLVIGIGFSMGAPMKKVAAEFPKVHFLLLDEKLDSPNVRSVTFNEHEGSYLVGALAMMVSKSKTIGFIGGMDIPLIQRFLLGYEKGAEATDKKAKVISNFVGSTSDAWRNPTKGKELALSQFQLGADVIFCAAGASGAGVFDAAEEKKKLAIGVDSNQNWVKPGFILTSMVKRIDKAVYDTIESSTKGTFEAKHVSLGLKEGGVGYAIDEHNRKLIPEAVQKKVDSIKQDIIRGKIKVPDFYVVGRKTSKG